MHFRPTPLILLSLEIAPFHPPRSKLAGSTFRIHAIAAFLIAVCAGESALYAQGRPTRTPTLTRTPRGFVSPTPSRTGTATQGPATFTPQATPTGPTVTATVTATATALSVGSPVAFRGAVQVTVGTSITGVAAQNLNPIGQPGGDDFLDLTVADRGGNSVRWLQGRGTGAFQLRVPVAVGSEPVGILCRDLDLDGQLDVATANAGGSVSVLFGRGNGGFDPAVSITLGGAPRAIAAIDSLLLIADENRASVVLVRVTVDRQLQAVNALPVGSEPVALASGDLDGNGTEEVAVANRASGTVSLLRLSAPDSVAVMGTVTVGALPSAVAIGDVNADGQADLLVGEQQNATLSVYLNARGAFTRSATVEVGKAPVAIAIAGDVERGELATEDGQADLFVVGGEANDLAVLAGLGGGRFEVRSRLTTGSQPAAIAVGQIDEDVDGLIDLAVANRDGTVSVLRGQGAGSYLGAAAFATDPQPLALVSADFDRDGFGDIVTLNQIGTVSLLRGNGRGSLRAPVNSTAIADPVALVSGDFNGDFYPDVVVSNLVDSSVALLRGSPTGFEAPRVVDTGAVSPRLVAVDLDLDGLADLLAMQPDLNRVALLRGTNSGLAASGAIDVGGVPVALQAGRVVGDGNPDVVVVAVNPARVIVYPGLGGGEVAAPVITLLRDDPSEIVLDDFVVDGIPDIATLSVMSGRLRVFRGLGDGTFDEIQDIAAPAQPLGLAAADLNGNGAADLVTLSNARDAVFVYTGTGSGQFTTNRFQVGRLPTGLVIAGLNTAADPTGGLAEVVTANWEADTVTVLRNVTRADAPPATPTETVGPQTPTPRPPASPLPTRTRNTSAGQGEDGGGGCSMTNSQTLPLSWVALLPLWLCRRQRRR